MSAFPGISVNHLLIFALVLARVSGLMVSAPVFGSREVPVRVRAALAVALAVVILPLQWGCSLEGIATPIDFLIHLGTELLIGLTFGLGALVLFSGLQLAGQTVAQMSGMQLADVVSPGSDTSAPVFSHLLHVVALAIFVIVGGHRQVLGAVLDTFSWLPPGSGGVSASLSETLLGLVSQAFALSVRASAAAMTALLISTLILGLIGRTLPQLNLMALGFGLSWLVTLVALALSLGAAAWIFQDQIQPALGRLLQAVGGPT